jgi:methionyl-tRNA synthetase
MDEIGYSDFSKLDIRIGEIIEAEDIEGSRNLIKLIIDFNGFKRIIFAGLKNLIKLNDLKGKKIPVLINIAPKKTPFGLSEGMILVAVENNELISLICPLNEIAVGSKIE